ncbi:unnamed protein product [Cuscuta campestris]|uniref:Uncharacterized protein n=1 Tax=Cuscuta campestris TaxID=132261 RepID=A0A484MWM7_9ASTE|nr:unnamed protein product [Cuscuta campestris]
MRPSSNDDRSRRAWAVTGLLRQRYWTVRDAVYPPFGSSSLSYHLGDHSNTMKESVRLNFKGKWMRGQKLFCGCFGLGRMEQERGSSG